jgi:hypothetical protein
LEAVATKSAGAYERTEVLLLGDYTPGHSLSVVRAPRWFGSHADYETIQTWLQDMERAGWQVGTTRHTVGFPGVLIELHRRVAG